MVCLPHSTAYLCTDHIKSLLYIRDPCVVTEFQALRQGRGSNIVYVLLCFINVDV